MRTNKLITQLGLAAFASLLAWGCVKDKGKEVAMENTTFTDQSFVQVYNAVTGSSRNYVYVDAVPVTGALLSLGSTFPSTPANYSVSNGFRNFLIKDTLSTTTQFPLSFAENLQAGNYYTIFTNNIVVPADTTARLRFANFVYSPTAIPTGFDIFSVKRNAVIFSNVRETEVTDFIPYASAATDTFYIRPNGSSSNLQNIDTTGKPTILDIRSVFTPTRLRNYTLIFRGSYRAINNKTSSGSAISSARQLSVFANY
jgi:hypothetical protein